MLDSAALDVAVGLFTIYFLLSVICTQVNEYISGLIGLRSGKLQQGIEAMLTGGSAEKLYAHPLIKALGRGKGRPSYIPSRTFAVALLNVLSSAPNDMAALRAELAKTAASGDETAEAILSIVDAADENLQATRAGIAAWFDQTMERVSGEYKRRLQSITLAVASVITLVTGADTFAITNTPLEQPGRARVPRGNGGHRRRDARRSRRRARDLRDPFRLDGLAERRVRMGLQDRRLAGYDYGHVTGRALLVRCPPAREQSALIRSSPPDSRDPASRATASPI